MNIAIPLDDEPFFECPWHSDTVVLFAVGVDGPHWANRRDDKLALLAQAKAADTCLYVAWPGQWSQNVFAIDADHVAKLLRDHMHPRRDRAVPEESEKWEWTIQCNLKTCGMQGKGVEDSAANAQIAADEWKSTHDIAIHQRKDPGGLYPYSGSQRRIRSEGE